MVAVNELIQSSGVLEVMLSIPQFRNLYGMNFARFATPCVELVSPCLELPRWEMGVATMATTKQTTTPSGKPRLVVFPADKTNNAE